MDIKIGDIKRAYVSRNGDISVKNLVLRIRLYDPTAMPPELNCDKWRIYTPYDMCQWLEPGMVVKFYIGVGFKVPDGFILYMFTNELNTSIETDSMFIAQNDTSEIEVTVRCVKSFYLRKYIHIANFLILPVLNTQESGIMCVPHGDEYR